MDVKIKQCWKDVLSDEFHKDYFIQLTSYIKSEYATNKIYPPGKLIFNAFEQCDFDKLKVVILGQDPYHGPGQAHGLCFSVNAETAKPPSLINIFKEIRDDIGTPIPENGNLERWARQGILLLNATLTVRANQAGSHQNKGWEKFTDAVVKIISDKKHGIVFLLWGAYAQRKGAVIDQNKHYILKSAHPSPLSAYQGFFGNKHFSKTNEYLIKNKIDPIIW
jgi:uracil-DNA glycosylase